MKTWFAVRGWKPWPFQTAAWKAFAAGREGLVHVPTGAGKTYAAFGGPLQALRRGAFGKRPGLKIVYVTPLRALARDIELALAEAVAGLGVTARVESRTGDTSSSVRARQQQRLPEVLVTTPESLALLIARGDATEVLAQVGAVIVDEWHELLGNKRGVQLQLTLTRLRALSPKMRTWGVSATLQDPEAAARALVAVGTEPIVVRGSMSRPVTLATLLPETLEAFPWAGHLGAVMLQPVLAALDPSVATLIFTNTRSQAERWYQLLKEARPEWAELLALHHGSIDKEARERAEAGLKSGAVRIVVATSSLDLGIDFPEVERVFQIGSPKGMGRLLQRAGRSAHRPLATCSVTCVPTHGLELLEFAAARRSLADGEQAIERRVAPRGALDVLVQHLVSCALGGGFTVESMAAEVRSAYSYRDLSDEDLQWCLRFITTGGNVLEAYPAYRRVDVVDGRYVVLDQRQARQHRLNIGTIVGNETAQVKLMTGKRLGSVEEGYIARLRPGDRFLFAGRTLELVKLRDLEAVVKLASGKTTNVPAWQGGFLPLSSSLGSALRGLVAELSVGKPALEPETRAAAPILDAQLALSVLPAAAELLVETWRSREGDHLFVHSFAGRSSNETISALLALRLSRKVKATFAIVANDYGFALITAAKVAWDDLVGPDDFTLAQLDADLAATVDAAQGAKRQFREIARIAGLVHQAYPGQRKTGRAVHASASLLYDTLERFDPGNALVEQAKREASRDLHEDGALVETLQRLGVARWLRVSLKRPSPFAFPLVVERIRARLGSESLAERVHRMTGPWR